MVTLWKAWPLIAAKRSLSRRFFKTILCPGFILEARTAPIVNNKKVAPWWAIYEQLKSTTTKTAFLRSRFSQNILQLHCIFSTVIITQGLTVQILWRKLLWNTKKFSLEGFQSRRPVYATGWRWKGTYFSTDTSWLHVRWQTLMKFIILNMWLHHHHHHHHRHLFVHKNAG